MEYIIRPVTISDYPAIYALWNSTEQSRRALNPVDDSREGIDRYLKRNPNTCFAAVKEERIIGVILTGHYGRRAIIHQRRAKVRHDQGKLKLRLILDRFSAEVFVGDGEQVLSATVSTDLTAQGISFYADGAVKLNVTKYTLQA